MAPRSPMPRSVERVVRATLWLGILWASATAGIAAWDLFRPTPKVCPLARPDESLPPLLGGEWRMRHGGFRVGVSAFANATELDARLKRQATPAGSSPSEFERTLLQWVDGLAANKEVADFSGARDERLFAFNQVRVRVLAPTIDGSRRLGLAQAAWPDGAGGWQMVEIEAVESGRVDASQAPCGFASMLTTGGEVVAERTSPGEGITGVCLVHPMPVSKLESAWNREGFRTTVEALGERASLLSARNRDGMRIWGLHATDNSGKNSFLLLVR